MLSTVFMLFMLVWMLALVVEFNLGAIPVVNRAYNHHRPCQIGSQPHFNRNFKGV